MLVAWTCKSSFLAAWFFWHETPSSSFHGVDVALKRLHFLFWDSPGRLTSIHPSSSASVTQGLGPFSSAATSSTSPNNRLLRRWNMTARFVKYWWLRCLLVVHKEKAVAAFLNLFFVFTYHLLLFYAIVCLIFSLFFCSIEALCWIWVLTNRSGQVSVVQM